MCNSKILLLAGFADDLELVLSELGPVSVTLFLLDEKTRYEEELPRRAIVVYVFSRDTGASSQFLSWFSYVHDHLEPCEEYMIAVRGVDAREVVFDIIAHIECISIPKLKKRMLEVVP
jgi:hypothetical protein